jgi:putative membrane protein
MNEKQINRLIIGISIAVPALVVVLFYTPALQLKFDVHFLPKFHAMINSAVFVLLILGLIFIKGKNIKAHRAVMISAMILSTIFLISYVIYHSASEPTKFGGEGFIRLFYYGILGTHILLAAVVLPFVLFTVARALRGNIEKHRKLARITFPLWLYVAASGVVVYFLIQPYY